MGEVSGLGGPSDVEGVLDDLGVRSSGALDEKTGETKERLVAYRKIIDEARGGLRRVNTLGGLEDLRSGLDVKVREIRDFLRGIKTEVDKNPEPLRNLWEQCDNDLLSFGVDFCQRLKDLGGDAGGDGFAFFSGGLRA